MARGETATKKVALRSSRGEAFTLAELRSMTALLRPMGMRQEATLSEQRRLFYVAITRCTEVLVLSSVARMPRSLAWKIGARLQPGASAVGNTIASRFLDELGPTAPAPRRGDRWAASGFSP